MTETSLPNRVVLSPAPLTPEEVLAVARHDVPVELGPEALEALAAARERVDALAGDSTPHYGISTGFGALANTSIPPEKRARLQVGLVRSHAASSGAEVEREVVRATMLLRLHTLATGRTGAQVETARTYAALLDAGITPVVREFGSLGCSGDLAPLAHCALAAMGEGEVRVGSSAEVDAAGVSTGPVVTAADAMAEAGITPVVLREKEGLALINGTDGMLGQLLMAIADLGHLTKVADLTAALSIEGLLGTDAVFAEDLQALRPQTGQAESAANLRTLLAGSGIVASHREDCSLVQDAYSLRCAPQVASGLRDTLRHAATVAAAELASAVDNPAVLPDGRVESNGNFHGAPLAHVLDFLAIPAADLASMAERRTDRFLDPARSNGLPPFLAEDPGTDSGLMIAQYTQAALVSELKRLAVPASVDSIPSSAMQEDHVSMGWSAARMLRRAVDALRRVLAIELYTATRGIELRQVERAEATGVAVEPSPAAAAVIAALRETVAGPGVDRYLSPEIEATVAFVAEGRALAAAEGAVGPLV
ncbi:histidine ammonia-lyase [Kytococcus aerolatus]|uniref:Histidine ammonia-lyase n=1 Tax=Kytococcus aerolatus TaxID=592308 RepID=A0A212U5W7_9MICO|nr:histidine ammonia-lyase [Kytococcus aerolatus]SNC73540.1 histidine ammonia-lyase [Kytococcus aerolatus]